MQVFQSDLTADLRHGALAIPRKRPAGLRVAFVHAALLSRQDGEAGRKPEGNELEAGKPGLEHKRPDVRTELRTHEHAWLCPVRGAVVDGSQAAPTPAQPSRHRRHGLGKVVVSRRL